MKQKEKQAFDDIDFKKVATGIVATGLATFVYFRYKIAGPSEYIVRTGYFWVSK